jgi:chemotaxis signal transduction protein
MDKLESLGALAGGIAHDFNNILTGIVGNISIAKLQIDPAHKILKRLELCEKAASRATELTRQLLTFSRGGEPVKKLINPALLIRETVSFALRGSNIGKIIEIPDNIWCLEVDESQLNQVLSNLLLNASQAMTEGGEIAVQAANETLLHDNLLHLPLGDYIKITVEDHGCGIRQENLVRIFDPYFTTKAKGSGLGLTTVHSIIKRHGGSIEVSSALGEGTTITIHLPAIPNMWPEDASTKVSTELTGSGRVLVMDDEDLIREIATHILDFMGYEVDTCPDGGEAIESFRAARENNVPFSAVILDLTILGGLSVAVGTEKFIIPLNSIVESLQPTAESLKTINGRKVVHLRGDYIPIVPLYELFNMQARVTEPEKGILVLIDAEGEKAAVLVDALLDEHQVVIKSIEENYRKVDGTAGATILGDGRVALILDVNSLLQMRNKNLFIHN